MAGQVWTKSIGLAALLLLAVAPRTCRAQTADREPSPTIEARPLGRLALDGVRLRTETQTAADADAERQSPAGALSGTELQALPLSGRNWENFVLDTTPSAAADESDSGEGRTRLRGGTGSAHIRVDGASVGLAFGSAGSGRVYGASLMGVGSSEPAVRQVDTVSRARETAADGAAGGRVEVQTEHGTNRLHGQAFVFSRGNLWGARNPFTQWVRETSPAVGSAVPVFTSEPYTPGDREVTWGAGMGGRVRHSKVFWFGSLAEHERNDPGVAMVRHADNFFAQPSNDDMQVLSARLGLSSVNPVAEGVQAYSGMLETLGGLLGPAPRTSTQWTGFGRVDWQANERQRFVLEGTGARRNAPGGGMTRTAETYGNHSMGWRQASQEWILGRWEQFLTPNLLLVTTASMGREIESARPETPSAYEQTLNVNAWGQLPQIVVDSRYGFTMGNPVWFGKGSYPDERLYEAQEQVDWVRGTVLVKAGVDLRHNRDSTSRLRNQTGTYYYSSLENFASDALAFAAYGLSGQLNPMDQHNCDQTGRAWRDVTGTLHGLGYLPCYSYYSQVMGPSYWWLSTNDWAGYVTTQWQPQKALAISLAVRWDREQLPPPIEALRNPDLPLTQTLPSPGNEWGPRVSVAWGTGDGYWPVLRMGYGMYFTRTENATLLAALTETGSVKGDLYFFMRPTDNLHGGGAPPFPYVLAGEPGTVVKPGAVEFTPGFRNGEVHQAVATLEETLPGRVRLAASGEVSLGRRLPVMVDANIDPAVNPKTITYAVVDGNGSGPIKAPQITVPFYASWPSATSGTGFAGRLNPNYQQVTEIESRANSTYEAAVLHLTRYGRGGLAVRARYTYAHAMDWNPSESALVTGPSVLDSNNFKQEYGTSNLDVRHSASTAVIWEPHWRLNDWPARIANGWMLSGIGYFRSGMPYSMRAVGSLAKEFDATGAAIVGLAYGLNGYGGDSRMIGVPRNAFRYPAAWKADVRLGKNFSLGRGKRLELLAESYNLFNHQNMTRLESIGYTIQSGSVNSLPRLNFLTGLKPGQNEFGKPLNINATTFYRQREIQFGARMRF